jgi:hypothetical protein
MPTIASIIKREIDEYARTIPRTNRLYLAAEGGRLTQGHVKTYVSGILVQIRGAMDVLRRAERRAELVGNAPLAAFLRHKLSEETGHDVWAVRDLDTMPDAETAAEGDRDEASPPESRVRAQPRGGGAIEQLLAYLDEVVLEEPTLFLSYMFLAEYLTVAVGGSWLRLLEDKCGIAQTRVTVVANHVELDREHVAEAMSVLDDLVGDRDLAPRMLEVVRESLRFYESFWDEVLATTQAA